MKSAYYVVEFLVLVEVILRGGEALSMNYYGMSCPFVEPIVRIVVNQALQKDPTLAAGLLRLHFHDCFVQGCDASVLLDSTSGKQQRRTRLFLGRRSILRYRQGAKDGTRSKQEDTFTSLPAPTLNTTGLINVFSQHGFTVWELVALSDHNSTKLSLFLFYLFKGHTLGVARCSSFKSRLSSFDSTHDVDPSMDPTFAKTLSSTCSAGDSAVQPFDATTNSFDNLYFSALQKGDGVLFSDQTLYVSPQTQQIVNFFAMNQAIFFFNFQQGMMKMGSLDVKEGVMEKLGRIAARSIDAIASLFCTSACFVLLRNLKVCDQYVILLVLC
uniref:Peroxidase n=1 Tax=Ananas comosus var. bracteatus TaxID=296719 RepID=A0A6V7Q6M3_ANACO|nr:unnamed protein product [Ananas comosus var. bracteatus]